MAGIWGDDGSMNPAGAYGNPVLRQLQQPMFQQPMRGAGPPQPDAAPMPWQQQPPPGLWDQITGKGNSAGINGSPLFRMGMEMLQRSTAGEQGLPGMTQGWDAAQRAQTVSRGKEIQEYQFQQALEAKATKDAEKVKLNEMLGANPQLAPFMGTGMGAQAAAALFAQQNKAFAPVKPVTPNYKVHADSGQLYDANTGLGLDGQQISTAEPAGASGLDFTDTQKFRKEYDSQTSVSEAKLIRSKVQALVELNKNPNASTDIATVFSFMKIMDPPSTVRESEYATAANAAGWGERARTLYNRAKDGHVLSPRQRREFMQSAGILANTAIDSANREFDRYTRLAQTNKVDPYRVVGDRFEQFDFGKGGNKRPDLTGVAPATQAETERWVNANKQGAAAAGPPPPGTPLQGDELRAIRDNGFPIDPADSNAREQLKAALIAKQRGEGLQRLGG